MRKLLILSVVTIMAAGTTGCNTCGNPCGRPSCASPCSFLSSWRSFGRQQQQCCQPAATECCNPCGNGNAFGGQMQMGQMDGTMQGSMMMPAETSCCQ